jgi:hypothetical protein
MRRTDNPLNMEIFNSIYTTPPPRVIDESKVDSKIHEISIHIQEISAKSKKVDTQVNGMLRDVRLNDVAVGIAQAVSDETKSDNNDEENNARIQLAVRIRPHIQNGLKKNIGDNNFDKKIQTLISRTKLFSEEISRSLLHGDKNLWFRFYRGPVTEEGGWARTKAGLYNIYTMFNRKPAFFKPKYLQNQEEECNVKRLIDNAIADVCKQCL